MQPGPRAQRGGAPTPGPSKGRRLVPFALLATAACALVVVLFGILYPPIRRDPGLSVLLVTIDTLRADALGCYGRKGAETPWIDRLAEGGVRFEEAHAHNVVTLPSHANLLSGRYPLEHGVRDNTGFRFPATQPTLATLLKAGGWQTGAFVSAFPLDSRFGLDRGFDVYDDRLGGTETTTAFLVPERKGTKTVAAARGWLEKVRGQRFFAFVHLYEPHFPYVPPEPFASRFRSEPYHGEVAAADAALEPLLEPILAAGPAARTLVVLTSDHGESLGEHGEDTHGVFAYEATLRVP
ncbi:MAG: sulfatase, partial [Vicinamibacteria bacterium]